jgi:hypothetical protein
MGQEHMMTSRFCNFMRASRAWLLLTVLVLLAPGARAAGVESLEVLQAGAHTYRNVTVTTKAKDYIFILHDKGMANVKLSEISPEVREALGYVDPAAKKATNNNNNAVTWAKTTLTKLETPQVKGVEERLARTWTDQMRAAETRLPPITTKLLLIAGGTLLALYLFGCYCCMLICQKAGQEAGPMVWLPVLQTFPMLRAAGMSRWWFLALFVPVLNLVAHVLWCLNISHVRGKTMLVALLLVLPPFSILAFLYLAFSDGKPAKAAGPGRMQIMTLESA